MINLMNSFALQYNIDTSCSNNTNILSVVIEVNVVLYASCCGRLVVILNLSFDKCVQVPLQIAPP